jgi:hypothetical protein
VPQVLRTRAGLAYPTLPHHTMPYHTIPPYPTLPNPTQPKPYLTLPYPTLPYPTLPYPTLPYPTLPYPTLPYPTLPYLTLPRVLRERVRQFAGLVVFHCPFKYESATSIAALKLAGHRLVMITGDQMLTACHVARELGMCSRERTLILGARTAPPNAAGVAEVAGDNAGGEGASEVAWRSPTDGSVVVPFEDEGDHEQLARAYDLCLPGQAWRYGCPKS